MDKIELKTILAQAIGKEKVVYLSTLVAKHRISAKDLIDLTFDSDEKVSFRAAWILENVYIGRLDDFLPAASYFLERFAAQHNLSCRRHYGKILALMTKKNAPEAIKEVLENYNLDALVEIAFAWLIDEEVPVAIKSHMLNILANLSAKQDWIRDELLQTMDYLVDKESIAFFAKVKQIRKQLKVK